MKFVPESPIVKILLKVMSLWHEKSDPTDISSYKTITLLNVECKTVSKVISYRLTQLMPNLLHVVSSSNILFFEHKTIKHIISEEECRNIEMWLEDSTFNSENRNITFTTHRKYL